MRLTLFFFFFAYETYNNGFTQDFFWRKKTVFSLLLSADLLED